MEQERNAYISILTSEAYLLGLKVLYTSLRRFTTREFIVMTDRHISEAVLRELTELGMHVIRKEEIEVDQGILSEKMKKDRWYHTLFKLRVFGLVGYDKLIYLDSDMLIRSNLEELFEKDEMCAVSDAVFFPGYSRGGINAGLFVVKPSKRLEEELIALIPEVAGEMDVFGDQDVINKYYVSWEEEKEKHLDVRYNACFYQLDQYEAEEPAVVHFILAAKPWMWTRLQRILKYIKWFCTGRRRQCRCLTEYMEILKNVR